MAARPLAAVVGCDQWARATHRGTALDGATGTVSLHWDAPAAPDPVAGGSCPARGLATDRFCRLYLATEGNVERLLFGPTAGVVDYGRLPPARALFSSPPALSGAFAPAAADPLAGVVGVAVDHDDRLFVAERGRRRVVVVELWGRRVLRAIPLAGEPAGLACGAGTVWVAMRAPAGLVRVTARGEPHAVPLPASAAGLDRPEPRRVAVAPDGEVAVLVTDAVGTWVVAGDRPPLAVGPASDLAFEADGTLVVAPCPVPGVDAVLRRWSRRDGGWVPVTPLDARGYDGGGIVRTTDDRIAYRVDGGVRLAVGARVRYAADGSVATFRLDAGTAHQRWGRLFVEACVPPGTDVRVTTRSSDEVDRPPVDHVAPDPAGCLPADTPSPPLSPVELEVATEAVLGPLHARRDDPRPWWRPDPGDGFEVREALVDAPPGRYLWVTIRLRGDGRSSPRIRSLRVEREAHTLVRRLPRVFTEGPDEGEFLHRYLALFDGMVHDLDQRAAARDRLVRPHAVPEEALGWLASFVGMVLDERWPLAARRRLVAEAAALYRRRGTVWALSRYLELYLGVAPVVVEQYRLRGIGGPTLGEERSAVVGFGLRVGGDVAPASESVVVGDPPADAEPAADGFATAAHRFTVVVPRLLDAEQTDVVTHVLDTERPAHTAYELCTLDAGLRLGRNVHLGLSSVIGRTGGFEPLVLDRSLLGRDAVLGWPPAGTRLGMLPLGEVRVG